MRLNNLLFILGLLVPALLAFRAFFLPGPLVFGDAPYFYPEGLKELVSNFYIWTNRGENFGGINKISWIYPLMYIYGFLYTSLGLNHDLIIRLIFYFPATILAFITPVFFGMFLGFPKIVLFFTSLVYGLNTYFLLLLDGGQVGVALAYGLFPLTFTLLLKLIQYNGKKSFLATLAFLLLLTLFDPRFTLIAFLAAVVWVLIEALVN